MPGRCRRERLGERRRDSRIHRPASLSRRRSAIDIPAEADPEDLSVWIRLGQGLPTPGLRAPENTISKSYENARAVVSGPFQECSSRSQQKVEELYCSAARNKHRDS